MVLGLIGVGFRVLNRLVEVSNEARITRCVLPNSCCLQRLVSLRSRLNHLKNELMSQWVET